MFIIKLLRWLKGYVSFTVLGAFAERFLNLVTRAGIGIWDIQKRGEILTAHTLARDYKRLRVPARKSGVRLRIGKRRGLPFHTRKYRRRIGLLIGIAVFFGFIIFMSQFIWSVEVAGNKDVSQFEILKALGSEGIKVGAFKNNIDVTQAKQRILLKLNDLSWIAINISGTTASVEVRERTPEPEMEPIDKPCNIVAAKPGQILKMEVYDGEALVKKGDTVKEGEIIVSGIIEDKFGKNTLKHAGATIIAQVQEQREYDIPLMTEITRYTGKERTKRLLSFLNTEVPIWFCGSTDFNYRLETSEKPLSLFGIPLPMNYKQELYREVVRQKVPVTADQAKEAVLMLLKKYEESELKDAEVVTQTVDVTKQANSYRVKANLVVNANIAKEQEILVENLV